MASTTPPASLSPRTTDSVVSTLHGATEWARPADAVRCRYASKVGNLSGAKILVILVVALIFLGPEKAPEVARQIGRVMAEIRKVTSAFQSEINNALQVPDDPSPVAGTVGETVAHAAVDVSETTVVDVDPARAVVSSTDITAEASDLVLSRAETTGPNDEAAHLPGDSDTPLVIPPLPHGHAHD